MKKIYIGFLFICLCIPVSCQTELSNKQNSEYTIASEGPDISIPIDFNSDKWQALEYSSLPPHKIQFLSNKMFITVFGSASPLIYPMANDPQAITKISIKGHVDQLVQIAKPDQQGKKGFDDFNLRVGLVLLGSTKLSWLKRTVAPKWVRKMFDLAPKNQGIDHIYFLNAVLSPLLLNQKRTHPLSEYIKEEYVWLMDKTGAFSYSKEFQKPQWTGALWVSVDGDDTKSNFQIEIQEIILTAKKKK